MSSVALRVVGFLAQKSQSGKSNHVLGFLALSITELLGRKSVFWCKFPFQWGSAVHRPYCCHQWRYDRMKISTSSS